MNSNHRSFPTCRLCKKALRHTFVDLGMSPLCESYVTLEGLSRMEPFYPLHAFVCDECFLVQLEEFVSADEIFSEYAYFSSYSDSWLRHARAYTESMTLRFRLSSASQVIEIASNDGYLLQYFVEKEVPVLGIEPAANVAEVASKKGIPTMVRFFGVKTAHELVAQGHQADLLLGNNVLAQVPDLNDFVSGMKVILKPQGVVTMEFPHLLRLIDENQFDTIYHEHFSYFSLTTVKTLFSKHGLRLFDVEELPTHGGSLRVFACHTEDGTKTSASRLEQLERKELEAGARQLGFYSSFEEKVRETKRRLLEFLIAAKRQGKSIVGYGAAGKGNTLLNYCGIRTDFIDYTVDRNPYKQGRFLPGSRIPIYPTDRIAETKPDYILIVPWNLKDEIMGQMSFVRDWGGRFVVPIPEVKVL